MSITPFKSLAVRVFDTVAMQIYPFVTGALGYRFRIGTGRELERDADTVLATVWGGKGLAPPPDAAEFSDRYNRAASVWIVAYHRGEPVGVTALLDMSIASLALDFSRKRLPPELDLSKTREIARLAIVPGHRGGAQTVMAGLCREMIVWSKANGIDLLFAGSKAELFQVFERFNPTARLIDPPDDPTPEEPLRARYFERIRAYGGRGVHFTFEVAGGSSWNVFSRLLTGRIHGKRADSARFARGSRID